MLSNTTDTKEEVNSFSQIKKFRAGEFDLLIMIEGYGKRTVTLEEQVFKQTETN